MTQKIIAAQAATELLTRRKNNQPAGPLVENLQPKNIEQSLAIQQELVSQTDDTVGGWKCLLPISSEQLVVAPIFSRTIQRQTSICKLYAKEGKAAVEPEIAFVLTTDLPARSQDYTVEEIDAAVGHCHMALELMHSRFLPEADVTFFEKLADCLVNQGIYLGPEINKQLAYQASKINISITEEQQEAAFDGKHPNNEPQAPLYWLINFMSKRGVSFKTGQAIITGSYAGIIELAFDKQYQITYQELGQYNVTFNEL